MLKIICVLAGMILLASEVLDGRADQRSFGAIDLAERSLIPDVIVRHGIRRMVSPN